MWRSYWSRASAQRGRFRSRSAEPGRFCVVRIPEGDDGGPTFVFKGDDERTLTVQRLNVQPASLREVIMEIPKRGRRGSPRNTFPREKSRSTPFTVGPSRDGYLRILPEGRPALTFSLRFPTYDRALASTRPAFSSRPNDEDEMTVAEIDRMAANISRSGGDPSRLLVKKEQRRAIAVATLVIILFGGPLATSSQRGGRRLRRRGGPRFDDPLHARVPTRRAPQDGPERCHRFSRHGCPTSCSWPAG